MLVRRVRLMESFADSCLSLTADWHGLRADDLFLGVGAVTTKSLALFSVFSHPFPLRTTAVAFAGAGDGALPRKQFAVAP